MNNWIKRSFIVSLALLLLSTPVWCGIQLKMVKVSHTYPGGPGTNGILVVDVYFRNTETALPLFTGLTNYYIHTFDFSVLFGTNLANLLVGSPGVTQVYFLTYAANYNLSATVNTNGNGIDFEYSFTGSLQTQMALTGNQVWNKVATVTFTHTYDGSQQTTFEWEGGSFTGWTGASVVNPDVIYQSVPMDLQDVSLPVEMSDIIAEFSYEKGIELRWTTQSEVNLEGFHVLRSDRIDGNYIRISDQLIPGQGNSSSLQEYVFVDQDVDFDQVYYYKLFEQSADFGDTSKTFFGPILGETGRKPTRFYLSSNYPNPFNPSTEFSFEITLASLVDVSVFNLIGQKIATLIHEYRPAGIYQVQWQGNNDQGMQVPSGVYIYRIQTQEGSIVQKMMKVE
jgi:hypothetical protein